MLKQIDRKLMGLVWLKIGVLCLLTLFNGAEISGQTKTKFSSLYTDTTKACTGAEPVFRCKGYGGYKIVIGVGGASSDARIEKDKSEYTLSIAESQSVGWNPKIEWRMANGKPFAIIVRVEVNDNDSGTLTKRGEKLVVKGLQGFENLDTSVDAKTPNANVKARELADKYFAENK